MQDSVIWILIVLVVGALCLWIGYFIRKSLAEAKISSAEQAAAQIIDNAAKRRKH